MGPIPPLSTFQLRSLADVQPITKESVGAGASWLFQYLMTYIIILSLVLPHGATLVECIAITRMAP